MVVNDENLDVSQDTIELLKECSAGCQMAVDSMEQISKYVADDKLKSLITKYNGAHIHLDEELHRRLNKLGEEAGSPNPFAKASSWITAEVKMNLKGGTQEAASLLTDGCNMGIKSLNEYKNQYKAADEKSVAMCDRLCVLESRMVEDLQSFL